MLLGLVMAVLWLFLVIAISVRWDKVEGAGPVIRPGPQGAQLHLEAPVRPRLRSLAIFAIGLGLTPFVFVFGSNCFLTIPPAHVAAVYDPLRGGIQKDVLPEGFHLVMPWWQTETFSQQTRQYTMSGSGARGNSPEESTVADTSIRCQTNEGMNVEIDCTVLFHVDPKDANDVWRKIGSSDEVEHLIVRPYTHNIMRMVVSKYSVVEVYTTRRKEIEDEIVTAMRAPFEEKGLVLEQLLIRNVQYGNPAFADAINAKQVAEQQVQTEGQNLSRAKITKQTVIAEAQGEATAIEKRGATLKQNPEVVQYEFVQKVAPKLKSMYLPAGALPIPTGGGK